MEMELLGFRGACVTATETELAIVTTDGDSDIIRSDIGALRMSRILHALEGGNGDQDGLEYAIVEAQSFPKAGIHVAWLNRSDYIINQPCVQNQTLDVTVRQSTGGNEDETIGLLMERKSPAAYSRPAAADRYNAYPAISYTGANTTADAWTTYNNILTGLRLQPDKYYDILFAQVCHTDGELFRLTNPKWETKPGWICATDLYGEHVGTGYASGHVLADFNALGDVRRIRGDEQLGLQVLGGSVAAPVANIILGEV